MNLQSRITSHSWSIILSICALYLATFALTYPEIVSVGDENSYINQAVFFGQGIVAREDVDPLTGAKRLNIPGQYPAGAGVLMAPFAWAFGWRGVFVVPCLALILSTLIVARWLEEEGRSPLFALVIMGFPAALAMGRIAMADSPSMLIIVLGLYCFWKGIDGGPSWWLASGFLAGASFTLREGNPLIFVPFFLGALIRRDRFVWALIVSGIAGVALRPLSSYIVFLGDPFFFKDPADFDPSRALWNGLRYLPSLLVLIPGGLVAGLLYRGRRAIEMRTSVLLFVAFYLFYSYSGSDSGLVKGRILGDRFMLPLLPLLAFALAEFLPRIWNQHVTLREVSWGPRFAGVAMSAWLVGLLALAIGANIAVWQWGHSRAELSRIIHAHYDTSKPMVTNFNFTRKLLREFDYDLFPIKVESMGLVQNMILLSRHGEFYVVLLDRGGSALFQSYTRRNADYVRSLGSRISLVHEEEVQPQVVIRIWHVRQKGATGTSKTPSPDGRDRVAA